MDNVAETVTFGTCGDSLTWEYDEKQKLLYIDGSGSMSFAQAPWEEWKDEMEHVLVMGACSRICAGAFRGFRKLRDVVVFQEGLQEIGQSAFEDCGALEAFDLPFSDATGIQKVSDCAFRNCACFKQWDADVAVVGNSAFENCVSLDFGAHLVGTREIGAYAFANCKGLSRLPMYDARQGWFCHGRSEDEAGYQLSVIPEGAFCGCAGLEKAAIPCTVVKIASNAFSKCLNLMQVLLTRQTEYDASAFMKEPALVDGFGLCGEDSPGDGGIRWVQNEGVLHFSGSGVICADPNGFSWEDPCCPPWKKGMHTVIIDEGCTAIAHSTFTNETSLKHVVIPPGVRLIGHYAFAGCVALEPLLIPESVKTIDPHAFQGVPNIIYHGPAWSEDNWGALRRNG